MFKSILWDFGSKVSNQILSFVVSVILARLLSPGEFGMVSIAIVFVGFSTLLLDLGFRNALVYKQSCSSELYSTVAVLNILGGVLLALTFFLFSDSIARFYGEPALATVIKVTTILFITNAATLVPNAINSKDLKFRELAFISIAAAFVSGFVAIWMACRGYGLWSIVARAVINGALVCTLNWWICSWRFVWHCRLSSLEEIRKHSSNFFITTLMEGVLSKADVLIIGRIFNSTTVGFYTRAQSLDNISRELTSGTMYSVFLPYFSKIQADIHAVRVVFQKCLHGVSFIVFFLNGVFFINANRLFGLVFGEKWLPSAPIFQLLTIVGCVYAINMVTNIALCGIGKTSEYLRVELWKKGVVLITYCFGFFGNLTLFLYLLLFAFLIGLILNFIFISKAIDISVKELVIVFLSYLLPAVVSASFTAYIISDDFSGPLSEIFVKSAFFLSLFVAINVMMKNKGFGIIWMKHLYLKAFINNIFRRFPV